MAGEFLKWFDADTAASGNDVQCLIASWSDTGQWVLHFVSSGVLSQQKYHLFRVCFYFSLDVFVSCFFWFSLYWTAWFKAVVSPGGPGRAGVLQQSWDGLSRRMGCAVGLERMRLEEGCPVFVGFLYVFRHQQPQQWRADVRVRSSGWKQVDVKTVRLRNRFVHSQKHSDCQVKYQCPGAWKKWTSKVTSSSQGADESCFQERVEAAFFSPRILKHWSFGKLAAGNLGFGFSQLELLTPDIWLKANGIHVSVVSSALILRIHVIILPYPIYERNNIP